jgi:hypothetical protein
MWGFRVGILRPLLFTTATGVFIFIPVFPPGFRQNPDGGKILGLDEDFRAGGLFLPQRSIS